MKSFLIIGMGDFGHHLCRELAKQKCQIMIVDMDSEKVEDMLPYVDSSKIGDCTNPEVLRSFGVSQFDACFVCMGSNFRNSIEITDLLKEMGAKRVICKADEDIQAKFLKRNGADEVIYPEKEAAASLAFSIMSDTVFDSISLSEDYLICEISPLPQWLGKSILELDFRKTYNLSILAAKEGDEVLPLPTAQYRFRADQHLMVLGHIDDIKKIAK